MERIRTFIAVRVIAIALGCVLGAFVWPAVAQFSTVRVQVVDVGQGDGVLIGTPNRRWIVIDAGTNRQFAEGMRDNWGVDRVGLCV